MSVDKTQLLICSAITRSFIYNTRRTEDSTHVTWYQVYKRLSRAYPHHLFPTPQKRIYTSQESDSVDASFETIPGKDGEEVILDFCMLFPQIKAAEIMSSTQTRSTSTGLQTNLIKSGVGTDSERFGTDGWEGWLSVVHGLDVEAMTIPLITELKQPMSRNCADVLDFTEQMYELLQKAQSQAHQQAHCIMSQQEFVYQNEVIAIAAAGEWWRYVTFTREGVASDNTNLEMLHVEDNHELLLTDLDRDTTGDTEPNPEMKHTPMSVNEESYKRYLLRLQQRVSNMTQQQNTRAQRRKRARTREQASMADSHDRNKKEAAIAYGKLNEEIDDVRKNGSELLYYNEAVLNNIYTLRKDIVGHVPEYIRSDAKPRSSLRREIGVFAVPEDRDRLPAGVWSGIMCLGSDISETHMTHIENKLASLVDAYLRHIQRPKGEKWPGLEGAVGAER